MSLLDSKAVAQLRARWRGLSPRERGLSISIPVVAMLALSWQLGFGPGVKAMESARSAQAAMAHLPKPKVEDVAGLEAARSQFEKQKAQADAEDLEKSTNPASASALAVAAGDGFVSVAFDAQPGWPMPGEGGRWTHMVELRIAGPFEMVSDGIANAEKLIPGSVIELALDRVGDGRVAARARWAVQNKSATWGGEPLPKKGP